MDTNRRRRTRPYYIIHTDYFIVLNNIIGVTIGHRAFVYILNRVVKRRPRSFKYNHESVENPLFLFFFSTLLFRRVRVLVHIFFFINLFDSLLCFLRIFTGIMFRLYKRNKALCYHAATMMICGLPNNVILFFFYNKTIYWSICIHLICAHALRTLRFSPEISAVLYNLTFHAHSSTHNIIC